MNNGRPSELADGGSAGISIIQSVEFDVPSIISTV